MDLKQLAIKTHRMVESTDRRLARIEAALGLEPDPSLAPVNPAQARALAAALRGAYPGLTPITPELVNESLAKTNPEYIEALTAMTTKAPSKKAEKSHG